MDKNLGTSLVMVNSQKGKAFFERVKSSINFVEVPFYEATKGNPALVRPLEAPRVDKTEFFADLDKMPFHEVARKYSTQKRRKSTLKKGLSNIYIYIYISQRFTLDMRKAYCA
jgi:hypothetical protein